MTDTDRAGARSRHPVVIGPWIGRWVPDARRGLRADLHGEGERIGLEAQLAVAAEDLELVELAGADAGHEQLPHARLAPIERIGMQAPVPAIEVADDPHAPRVRRPDREAHARRRPRACAGARRARRTAARGCPRRSGGGRPRRSSGRSDTGRRAPTCCRRRTGSGFGSGTGRAPGPATSPAHRPSPSASIGAVPPFGATSCAPVASGWKARMTVPPSAGCAPRMACGSWCSPRTRRAMSSDRGRGGAELIEPTIPAASPRNHQSSAGCHGVAGDAPRSMS